MKQLSPLLLFFLLAACTSQGKPVKEPPVFGTNQALETELASVNGEIEQMNSLIADAQGRIKQYRKKKPKGTEGMIIGAEAEIHNSELRKISLLKRKRELESQIQRQH